MQYLDLGNSCETPPCLSIVWWWLPHGIPWFNDWNGFAYVFFTSMWTFTQNSSIQPHYHQERCLFIPWKLIPFRLAAVEKLKSEKSDVRLPWFFQAPDGEHLGGETHSMDFHGMAVGWLHEVVWPTVVDGYRTVQYFSIFEIDPFHLLQVNAKFA